MENMADASVTVLRMRTHMLTDVNWEARVATLLYLVNHGNSTEVDSRVAENNFGEKSKKSLSLITIVSSS
jgi:hypothetical protein